MPEKSAAHPFHVTHLSPLLLLDEEPGLEDPLSIHTTLDVDTPFVVVRVIVDGGVPCALIQL